MTYSGLHFDELRKQQQLESWQQSEEQNVPLGYGLANAVEGGIQRGVGWLQEQAEDDPDTWTDDALRLMGGGLKNISNIPGMGLIGKVGEAGGYVGGGIAEMMGVDRRIGGFVGSMAADAALGFGAGKVAKLSKAGAIVGAQKYAKTTLPGRELAAKGVGRHYSGLARDRLKVTKQQFGGRQATEAFASDIPRDLNIQSGTAWWVDGPISNERYNRLNWNGYAATHHVGEVSPVGTALRALDPEKQRIVQGILRFEKGLPVGNDPANFVTAFDTLTQKAYRAKVDRLVKEFALDERTVKDLLKVPEFRPLKKMPSKKQIIENHADEILALPDSPTALDYRRFEGRVRKGLPGENEYHVIRNNKKEVLFHPKTDADQAARWDRVTGQHGAYKRVREIISDIDSDPTLNIMSQDHMTALHGNYSKLNSFKRYKAAIKDPNFAAKSANEVADILGDLVQDQRHIVTNYFNHKVQFLYKKFPELRDMTAGQARKLMEDNIHEFAKTVSAFEVPSLRSLTKPVSLKDLGKDGKMVKALFGLQEVTPGAFTHYSGKRLPVRVSRRKLGGRNRRQLLSRQ